MRKEYDEYLDSFCVTLCSLKKRNGKILLTDAEGKSADMKSKKILPRSLRKNAAEKVGERAPYSVVWILTETADGKTTVLQVGRNNTFDMMWKNDISPDIWEMITEKGNYGKLLNEKNELTFRLVIFESYLENVNELKDMRFSVKNDNEHLKSALGKFRAAYAEGKLAAEYEAEKFNTSGGIDSDIYEYYGGRKNDLSQRS